MQLSKSSTRRHSLLLAPLGLLALAGGCAYGEIRQVVRAQFAAELSCPDVVVEERKVYEEAYLPGQYRAKGCGVTRTYTCPSDTGLVSYDEKACTFEEGDVAKVKAPAAPKPTSGDAMGGDSDPMMDEPAPMMDEPAPAPAPAAKTKGKAGKAGPKPSGKFKVEADVGGSADIEGGDLQ